MAELCRPPSEGGMMSSEFTRWMALTRIENRERAEAQAKARKKRR